MRNIFITDEQVKSAQALLAGYKSKGAAPKGASDADLWRAQRVVGAVIHGPTGETMPLIGRMSMFVPVNVPIAAGLIMSQSVAASVFWQWLNQTYNVVNNYVNRAGPTVEMGPLVQSYVLAVGSACGIAIGAKSLLKAVPALQAFGLFVPYLAVITAGTCNVGFTRMDEIRNGIDVSDADGNVLGRSVAAGKIAVFKTVTTRSCFLPIFPLVIPPLTMKALGAVAGLVPGSAAAHRRRALDHHRQHVHRIARRPRPRAAADGARPDVARARVPRPQGEGRQADDDGVRGKGNVGLA